jgi:hypothetical protein
MRLKLESRLKKALPAIEKRVDGRGPRETVLRARLTSEGPRYHLTLSLRLPGQPVVVAREGIDLVDLIADSQTAFRRELSRLLGEGRSHHKRLEGKAMKKAAVDSLPPPSIKKPSRMAKMNGNAAGMRDDPDANEDFERLRPLLAPVYLHARRALRAAVMAGELPPGYMEADDLVDQAMIDLIEAHTHADKKTMMRALYAEVDMLLAREIKFHNPGGQHTVSLEASADSAHRRRSRAVPDGEALEDVIPQEALRMEDVLVDDHAQDPSAIMSQHEEYRLILKYLGRFPSKARTAFFLHRIEGFEPYEIAMIQNRAEDAVKRDVADCLTTLRNGWKQLRTPPNSLPHA